MKLINSSPLSFNFKIRSLQLINHILAVIGFIYAGVTDQWSLLWISLVMYVIYTAIGITCGMHRYLSHKSFKTSKFWERVMSFCSIYATVGSTITWVAVHRFHHINAEKPNDPHSPYIGRGPGEKLKFNLWQAFKSWVGMWGHLAPIPPRYVIDLIHDPFHSWMHKHYFKIIFATCFLIGLIDPWLIFFVYIIPACGSFHATSVISVIAHIHGYKPYKINDESRNTWIGAIITLGDGWHNTHHAKPGTWNYHERWWELDPCAWFIWAIKKD